MVDITRLRKNAEMKVISVASALIKHGDVAATTQQLLYNLPANSLIIEAGISVDVAGQGGLTVDFGFDGGNELGNDIAISSTGYKQVTNAIASLTLTEGTPNTLSAGTVTKSPRILTGTGKAVTATFSADPSAGEFHFIVQFIEYTVGNGQFMNYGNGS